LRGRVAIVLLDVGFHCLFGVAPGMNYVTSRDVSMVCRGFVASGLMMFGSFLMMASRVGKVFRDFFVVSCSLLRHDIFLQLNDPQSSINAGDHRCVPIGGDRAVWSPIPILAALPLYGDVGL
jgi:hypothetical protein